MSYQYFTRIAAVLAFNDLHGNLELPIISVREKINGELKDVQEVSV